MSAIAARPPFLELGRDGGAATRIAGALLGVAGLAAAAVALGAPGQAREWLGFGFGGIDNRVSEATSIFANNARLLVAILLACGVAQLALTTSPAGLGSRLVRALALLCDVAVVGSAALQAILVGAAVGAYGGRMVAALLPHGPLELAAYSLVLALYVAARRERLAPGRWLAVGLASVLVLALAAPVEVFVSP